MHQVEGLTAYLISKDDKHEFAMTYEKVDDPSEDILLKAKLQSANQKIFELIQRVQKENDRNKSYEELKGIDTQVDAFVELTMKVKDRELRKELMEKVQECKSRTVQVLGVLRKCLNGAMTNAHIAELNDCAFKAIRKQGAQKKLDERAMKNDAIFKANDQKLKNMGKNIDEAKLREQHKDLIDMMGQCPMSCCDIIELMQQGDCICLALDISRSEAVISDPTKL